MRDFDSVIYCSSQLFGAPEGFENIYKNNSLSVYINENETNHSGIASGVTVASEEDAGEIRAFMNDVGFDDPVLVSNTEIVPTAEAQILFNDLKKDNFEDNRISSEITLLDQYEEAVVLSKVEDEDTNALTINGDEIIIDGQEFVEKNSDIEPSVIGIDSNINYSISYNDSRYSFENLLENGSSKMDSGKRACPTVLTMTITQI